MNPNASLGKKILAPASSVLFKAFRYLLLLGVSYIVVFPIISMISKSFMPAEEIISGTTMFVPANPTFGNFKQSLEYFNFPVHFAYTIYMVGISTLLQVLICSLVGYGLGRYKFKGNAVVYAAVLFTIILPMQTVYIPLYYNFRWFDFFGIGKLVGLITGKDLTINLMHDYWNYFVSALFGVGLNSGIYIFMFRQFFAGMPKDMEEAAKLDGCGPFKIYWKVMIPNIKPVIVTVALLSVIFYWNDTLLAGMSNIDNTPPILLALKNFSSTQDFSYGVDTAQAIAVHNACMLMAVSPLMIVFLFCQRFFVECMDRSGIKG